MFAPSLLNACPELCRRIIAAAHPVNVGGVEEASRGSRSPAEEGLSVAGPFYVVLDDQLPVFIQVPGPGSPREMEPALLHLPSPLFAAPIGLD